MSDSLPTPISLPLSAIHPPMPGISAPSFSSPRFAYNNSPSQQLYNPLPQNAPGKYVEVVSVVPFIHSDNPIIGAAAAIGHTLENSIPLSIFPIATDKFAICFCGLPGESQLLCCIHHR